MAVASTLWVLTTNKDDKSDLFFKYRRYTVFCVLGRLVVHHLKPVIPEKSVENHESRGVISQSVLLGYSNADKLSYFSAYRWKNETTVILSSYGYLNRLVYCRLFDANRTEILSGQKSISVFPEFTVKCGKSSSSPREKPPVYVAVTINKKDIPETMQRISEQANLSEKKGTSEFTVCLAPLFGETPKNLMLMEFIEYYSLQGADNFLIYTHSVSNETAKLLDFYQKNVKIKIEIIPIGNTTKCANRHRCRHEMQLQDCVYRTQNYAKWVATVDLDERIMPVNEDTRIIDLLRNTKSPAIAELRFRCQWTLRYSEIPHGPPQIKHLPMMTWHNTSHVAPQNHTTKSIIRPSLVESMGVHGVLKMRKMGNSNFPAPKLKLVEPEEAVVRHYRLTQGWSFFLKEAESFGDFWHYEISHGLGKEIVERVDRVIEEFAGYFNASD
uniref:Glycosyltransferase family 92 protein n=2 Tax=Caenorhabditis japonica TaxID=281687 RepID=A0A8R1DL70_CAEJA